MFKVLSDQNKLLSLINRHTGSDLELVCDHLTQACELLNSSAAYLLANRKKYGVLIPEKNRNTHSAPDKHVNAVPSDGSATTAQTSNNWLLDFDALIDAINLMCLTEATLARYTIMNCLMAVSSIEETSAEETSDVSNKKVNRKTQKSPSLYNDIQASIVATTPTTLNPKVITPAALTTVKKDLTPDLNDEIIPSVPMNPKVISTDNPPNHPR